MLTDAQWTDLEPLVEVCRPKGSVRARANMYHVSGKAIVAATRRALDDATIQVAVKGAVIQKAMGSSLRSPRHGSNRPKVITSPYEVLALADRCGRACPAVGWAVSKAPATHGLAVRNRYDPEPRRVSRALPQGSARARIPAPG